MKTCVFYDVLVKSSDGQARRCFLKIIKGKEISDLSPADLCAVGGATVFSLDDLYEIEILSTDEVRIMGNGPVSENLLNWQRGAVLEKIKKMQRRAKKFFKARK